MISERHFKKRYCWPVYNGAGACEPIHQDKEEIVNLSHFPTAPLDKTHGTVTSELRKRKEAKIYTYNDWGLEIPVYESLQYIYSYILYISFELVCLFWSPCRHVTRSPGGWDVVGWWVMRIGCKFEGSFAWRPLPTIVVGRPIPHEIVEDILHSEWILYNYIYFHSHPRPCIEILKTQLPNNRSERRSDANIHGCGSPGNNTDEFPKHSLCGTGRARHFERWSHGSRIGSDLSRSKEDHREEVPRFFFGGGDCLEPGEVPIFHGAWLVKWMLPLFSWSCVASICELWRTDPWGDDPIWRAYFSNGCFNHQLVNEPLNCTWFVTIPDDLDRFEEPVEEPSSFMREPEEASTKACDLWAKKSRWFYYPG